MKKNLLTILSSLVLLSCTTKEPYQKVSDEFVKSYYQQMNQEVAVKYTDMMAKDKLQKELELVREARAKNPQLETNKAKVTTSLSDLKLENNTAQVTYKLTIQTQGGNFLDKVALLTLKKGNKDWKVIDYEEMNAEPKK